MASASSPKERDNVTKDTIQPQKQRTTSSSFAVKKKTVKMQVWNTVPVVPGG